MDGEDILTPILKYSKIIGQHFIIPNLYIYDRIGKAARKNIEIVLMAVMVTIPFHMDLK